MLQILLDAWIFTDCENNNNRVAQTHAWLLVEYGLTSLVPMQALPDLSWESLGTRLWTDCL